MRTLSLLCLPCLALTSGCDRAAEAPAALALVATTPPPREDDSEPSLGPIDRTIAKEPLYRSGAPRYCLLIHGPGPRDRSWLVQDGDVLYVDRNGDGDLTDPAERFEAHPLGKDDHFFAVKKVSDGGPSLPLTWLTVYQSRMTESRIDNQRRAGGLFAEIDARELARIQGQRGGPWTWKVIVAAAPPPGVSRPLPRQDNHQPHTTGPTFPPTARAPTPQPQWGDSVIYTADHDSSGYLLFADRPEDAPVIICTGRWTFGLLGVKPAFTAGHTSHLSTGMGTPGIGPGSFAFVKFGGPFPVGNYPVAVAEVTFPPLAPGGERVTRSVPVGSNTILAPPEAGPGLARLRLSFDAWREGRVKPATFMVPVSALQAAESPQHLAALPGHRGGVACLAVSPDGRTLAAGCATGGAIKLWDLATRRERATLECDLGDVTALAFVPGGRGLAAGYQRRSEAGEATGGFVRFTGGVVLWDVAAGRQQAVLAHKPPRGVTRLAFAPDGRTLAALEMGCDEQWRWYSQEGVTFWDVGGRQPRATTPTKCAGDLAYAPDGRSLAFGHFSDAEGRITDCSIARWDAATGQRTTPLRDLQQINALPTALAFAPDGRTLAAVQGGVVLWDLGRAAVRAKLPLGDRRVLGLAFAPDGKTLALALGDRQKEHAPGLVVLWDTAGVRQRAELTGHTGEVTAVAFSPDGKTLVSGGSDGAVRLWNPARPAGD